MSHQLMPGPAADFLRGGGEMGERIRAKDWSSTPLGPVEQWPQSLRTVVRIMLTSRQPIWIGWGPDLIKLYNDPYKAIVGGKHPQALGQPASVVWREIWDQIEPRLQRAVEQNEGTYDEALLLIMERYGYPEETYYTFSYSPVPGDQGDIGGIICANTDDTQRIIGERQIKLLQTLATKTTDARSIEEACHTSTLSLAENPYDIPFAALYLFDQEGQMMTLAGTSGLSQNHFALPETVALTASTFWPFAEALKEQKPCLTDLASIGDMLPTGAWKCPPRQAVVLPIAPSGHTGKGGILLVGLNPFRLFDGGYQGFLNLVAGQIAASLARAQAYEEERKRVHALAELDQAKTLFFSNISHEFRTPLTLMLGPIEDSLAEPQALSPVQRARLEILQRNALRLLKLVNGLLDFSRLEAGRFQAVYEPTDLAALTTDLASNFRSVIERAGMQLIVNCHPLDEPVYVDQEMWEKIILNLLSNAFKYTLEGKITISLKQQERTVAVSITDTGIGIPAEEIPHMFERFHRVKGAAGRTIEGTGIGLSLVQELVKLHGGTIHVTSTLGQGSTFTIVLPRGASHLPPEQIAGPRTLASTAVSAQVYVNEAFSLLAGQGNQSSLPLDAAFTNDHSSHGGGDEETGARILFADDNADMRDYISRLLKPRYAVQAVPNGQAALAAVQESTPDLIITDVMMPGMDGFELLHALRADQQTRTLPVILLSARAGEEAQIDGLAAGANDYLIKPFSARELLARIEAQLEIARLRKEAEASVKAERQRLYELFQQSPAVIVVLRGPNHILELVNPLAQQFMGVYRPLLGIPIREALPELEGQVFFDLLDTVYQTGEPYLAKEALVRLDRRGDGILEEIYFNFVYQPSFDASGKIDGILVFAYEVTELVVSRQKIEDLSRQKDDFLGVASHELKTPVTSLKAFTQLLERQFQKEGDIHSAALLRKMDAQLNKLTSLVEDLLDVTKIENGQLRLHVSSFVLDELVNEIIEETQRTADRHTIVPDLAASVCLTADRDRIGQVLTNLLTNAIKYSPQADTVLVKTRCIDETLTVSVQDFGIGIPKAQQQRLFERFYRVEGESQSTYPGLGLGLYIAASFVSRHHGSMWLESTEGEGTTVSFSLPRQYAPEEHNDKGEQSA